MLPEDINERIAAVAKECVERTADFHRKKPDFMPTQFMPDVFDDPSITLPDGRVLDRKRAWLEVPATTSSIITATRELLRLLAWDLPNGRLWFGRTHGHQAPVHISDYWGTYELEGPDGWNVVRVSSFYFHDAMPRTGPPPLFVVGDSVMARRKDPG
jgi:hypothetical protein